MRRPVTTALLALPVALSVCLVPAAADAKLGSGANSGSRGSRTFSAPAPTATAPRAAQPMQRTETPGIGQARPGVASPSPSRFGSGLMAGLVGAGVLGLLFGGGFFGGLSGLSSLFGLLAQAALIAGAVWLVLRLLRSRREPAMAGVPGHARTAMPSPLGTQPAGSAGGADASGGRVVIGPADYATFERILTDAQDAYGRGDTTSLGRLATPEMVRYFATDLDANRRRGVRNEISGVRLLQGDLSEAWREGATEYATVAMRFSMTDVVVDLASGRVVEGRRDVPSESTEAWTFRRDRGGAWQISAIQQAA